MAKVPDSLQRARGFTFHAAVTLKQALNVLRRKGFTVEARFNVTQELIASTPATLERAQGCLIGSFPDDGIRDVKNERFLSAHIKLGQAAEFLRDGIDSDKPAALEQALANAQMKIHEIKWGKPWQ